MVVLAGQWTGSAGLSKPSLARSFQALPLFLGLAAFPQCCLHCWQWLLEGTSGAFPRGQGDNHAVFSEPAVSLSSPRPRFPACLEVLCYIWVNQRMLSDVLTTGELLQGQELPHLSLLPSMVMECAPEAAPCPLPSPGDGRDPPEVLGCHVGPCVV